jgi:hypothetical protein
MDRDELTALRDAIDVMLAWPDALRAEIARWLSPEAAKPGNGLDPHPPPVVQSAEVPKRNISSPFRSPTPHAGKARPGAPATSAKAAEQRLLAAMQEHSGATVIALAKAAGANRSSTGERLRGLASRGVVTKDSAGHWRLVAELAGEEPGPTEASRS